MDFYANDHRPTYWQKVTKKMVDPITFYCRTNVENMPRSEDFLYETTCLAISHPRFGDSYDGSTTQKTKIKSSHKKSKQSASGDYTASSPTKNGKEKKKRAKSPAPGRKRATSPSSGGPPPAPVDDEDFTSTPIVGNRKNVTSRTGGKKPASLGAFFSKSEDDQASAVVDHDNMSVGSRSLTSRSVADRSLAERSKTEETLKKKAKERKEQSASGHSRERDLMEVGKNPVALRRESKESVAMQSIGEFSCELNDSSKFEASGSPQGGQLGNFLSKKLLGDESENSEVDKADTKSVMSASTMGSRSVSQRSNAELSRHERKLKSAHSPKNQPRTGVSSHLELFMKNDSDDDNGKQEENSTTPKQKDDDDDEKSIGLEDVGPVEKKLRFKEGHSAMEIPELTDSLYDDLFYTSEELADFRYEAFLEEAGLDVDEYMNM